MSKDIGDLCVHCRRDTSFGSGLFVNRYPVSGDEDGYCCDECEQKYYKDNEETGAGAAEAGSSSS